MSWDKIVDLIESFKTKKEDYEILVIANVSNTVQTQEDFIRHASYSEFFTKAEFASIISAITEEFGYVRIFYSEIEFINYILDKRGTLSKENLLVYNFARDGLHEGKKSLIPAFCDLFEINYTGSNPFVISLLRNKFVYSQFLGTMGIPVPVSIRYTREKEFCSEVLPNECQLIAKNIFESASIGMSENNIITNWSNIDINGKLNELCNQLQTDEILVQNYISGIECEVFVIKYKNKYYAFQPIKIILAASDIITSSISDTYDYSFALLSEDGLKDVCMNIKQVSEKAAELLNIKGYARFDYRINATNEFFLIDIAGTPYLTRHSSIAFLFTKVLNLKYSDIFIFLAALTASDYPHEVNCKSDNNKPLDIESFLFDGA